MKIQDMTTADVSFVGPETAILEIARKMRDGNTPVVVDERLVGARRQRCVP